MKKIIQLLILIFILFLSVSCGKSDETNRMDQGTLTPDEEDKTITGIIKEATKAASEEVVEENIELSVWQVYWSNDEMIRELELLKESVHNVIHFAAYFNAENELFIPKEIVGQNKVINTNEKYKHYLSFVNDKILSDGSSSLKDTTLLYELFHDSNTMEQHMNNICGIAIENGYDGIEIDYEAMKDDLVLWKLYLNFIQKLYQKTQGLDLELRVVLEPSAPLDDIETNKLSFPNGPQYVMMCYNLHGYGSEPGAKADKKFTMELTQKMKLLSPNIELAFSTGGFDWDEEGNVKALTESEAKTLHNGSKVIREEESAALTFNYQDKEGKNHTVWYADGTTIQEWMEIGRNNGISKFSLWRLNGNEGESLVTIGDWINP